MSDNIFTTGVFLETYTEKVLLMKDRAVISEENSAAIQYALEMNNAVGVIAGYYDEKLTIFFVSNLFMKNLGYTTADFAECTGGSLKNIILDEDRCFFEGDAFSSASGEELRRMVTKDGTPVFVRMFKTESYDSDGVPIWVLSVRIEWDAQNFSLVNDIIQSGG